uniref:Uncharacterized protein n=1 Tax=Denticeps clupeoides TaxID=299321 RepID=A0AAY4AQ09_9TELE
MPKRGLDLSDCEVFRFYRLVGIKNLVEPVSLIVPRKSDGFQDDLFPPTAANEAAMSAAEWIQGHTRGTHTHTHTHTQYLNNSGSPGPPTMNTIFLFTLF